MQFLGKQTTLTFLYNILFIVGLTTFIPMANAANLTLAWKHSPSSERSGYKLYYGTSSKQYTQSVNVGKATTHTLKGLLPGQTYYIAATTYCNCNGFQESGFSRELKVKIPAADKSNAPATPQGGGQLVYTAPPSIEIGEVLVGSEWKKVGFQKNFADPVVVAPSSSYAGPHPGVVRIRNITSRGFEIRFQEWDYLDRVHSQEKVHFIAMERGHYTLPNGAGIEAGTIETGAMTSFDRTRFVKPFNVSPVVLTSISSDKGPDAITVRKKDISVKGFSLLLQEQEANSPAHGIETVDYIAAEPSRGKAGAIPFEIGRTKSVMRHNFKDITFLNTYPGAPVVILDLQTANDIDSAALRWKSIAPRAVKVKVEEEGSKDGEIEHIGESIGYIVFGLGK